MSKHYRFMSVLLALIALFVMNAPAKAQQDLVTLNVNAGYDSYFRGHYWIPLQINVTNQGDPITGRLIARQERSPALTNSFSTPVTLASGSRQTFFLYVAMEEVASSVLVELLDESDVIITDVQVTVRNLTPRDKLYVVVTNATNSNLDMSTLVTGGNKAFQANWFPANIPDKSDALSAIDAMVFTEVDTGTLSLAQREAIAEWVLKGGHLVVTGGVNWQPAAAGLVELLPITLSGTTSVPDFSGLALLAGDYDTSLEGNFIISTGELSDEAQVLAASSDDTPLLTRHQYGIGTVDYLATNPIIEPLRSWINQKAMWQTMLVSVDARPSWNYGFTDLNPGIDSIEILPGFTALPQVTSILGFLVLYIVLVGPVNYLVLNRLNRRELAWVTIPALILLFSILAWTTGFNLRGNEVTLSRMSVVHTWANHDTAYSEQLIGLLAPRRANYTLAVSDDRLLRPVIRPTQSGRWFGDTGSTIEVEQSDNFKALDFPVDASFIAAFTSSGTLPAPAISGRIAITYDTNNQQHIRGTIRNDSEIILTNPVILARGQVIRLTDSLEPGELYILDQDSDLLQSDGAAAASPMEYLRGKSVDSSTRRYNSAYNNYGFLLVGPDRTVRDIIGDVNYEEFGYYGFNENVAIDQETRRRQRFLNAFVTDQFGSTGRGNNVYLLGWTDQAPFEDQVTGAAWSRVDSTVYIIELETEVVPPSTTTVISGDQFTWTAIERDGVFDAAPNDLTLYVDSTVIFRFTPLPDARLSEVEQLFVVFQQGNTGSRAYNFQLELWDWQNQVWEIFEIQDGSTPIGDPERFVGPLNSVQMRLDRDLATGYTYIANLAIEQRGSF